MSKGSGRGIAVELPQELRKSGVLRTQPATATCQQPAHARISAGHLIFIRKLAQLLLEHREIVQVAETALPSPQPRKLVGGGRGQDGLQRLGQVTAAFDREPQPVQFIHPVRRHRAPHDLAARLPERSLNCSGAEARGLGNRGEFHREIAESA